MTTNRIRCQIANMAFDVVRQRLADDQKFAQSLRTPTTGSRQIIREESMTDSMLVELQRNFPDSVQIVMFTQSEENSNGADWYWSIEAGDQVLHAFVQAKRVQRTEFGQDDIDGGVEINRQQLTRMAEAVLQSNLPGIQAWFALYARIDALPPCGLDPFCCRSHNCLGNCQNLPNGSLPSVFIRVLSGGERFNERERVRSLVSDLVRLDCILTCFDHESDVSNGPWSKGFRPSSGLDTFENRVAQLKTIAPSVLTRAVQIKLTARSAANP